MKSSLSRGAALTCAVTAAIAGHASGGAQAPPDRPLLFSGVRARNSDLYVLAPSWQPAAAASESAAAGTGGDSISLGDDLYVKRIGENLWLHVSSRELDGRPAWSNGVVVAGPRGAIVIDTPWEDEQTARLLDWIDGAIGAPVIGVVVTHFHDDRMGGIRTVHARGIPTYGSWLTAWRAKREGDPPPMHTFRDHVGLSTGADSLDVFYPGPGHTRDNVAVWLPQRRVLVGGCMVRGTRTRSLGFTGEADLKRWPASLGRVRERCGTAEVVIPGHGAIGGLDAIANTERLLRERGEER